MSGEMRGYRNPQVLYDLYWRRGMSSVEIGEVFGVGGCTIRRWMAHQNIERRSASEVQSTSQWSFPDDQKQEINEMLDERGPARRSLESIVMPDGWEGRKHASD